MGRVTISEVRDRSGDPRMSRTGQVVIWKVRDGLGGPPGGPGLVGGPSRRSWTGRGTLSKVWNGESSQRSEMGRGTL